MRQSSISSKLRAFSEHSVFPPNVFGYSLTFSFLLSIRLLLSLCCLLGPISFSSRETRPVVVAAAAAAAEAEDDDEEEEEGTLANERTALDIVSAEWIKGLPVARKGRKEQKGAEWEETIAWKNEWFG